MKATKLQMKTWIRALRSGEYKQGRGALQTDSGFCCLGVACDVFVPKALHTVDDDDKLVGGVPTNQEHTPEWLRRVNHDFLTLTGTALITLNDGRATDRLDPHTFDEIADLLQAVYIHEVLND